MFNKMIYILLIAAMVLIQINAWAEDKMSDSAKKCKDANDIIKCFQDYNKEHAPSQDDGGASPIMSTELTGAVPVIQEYNQLEQSLKR